MNTAMIYKLEALIYEDVDIGPVIPQLVREMYYLSLGAAEEEIRRALRQCR